MTKFFVFLIASSLPLFNLSCGDGTDETEGTSQDEMNDTSAQIAEIVEVENSNLLQPGVVGVFTMGLPVPQLPAELKMRKATHLQIIDGTTDEIDMIVIYGHVEDMVDLHLEQNDGKEEKDLNINEMRVHSDYFRTTKDIGVNSTIEELVSAYPEIIFWYLSDSETYIGETGELPGMQFIFNKADCTKNVNSNSGEPTSLTVEDFIEGSVIETVRVF